MPFRLVYGEEVSRLDYSSLFFFQRWILGKEGKEGDGHNVNSLITLSFYGESEVRDHRIDTRYVSMAAKCDSVCA